jgi:hypothetical protein
MIRFFDEQSSPELTDAPDAGDRTTLTGFSAESFCPCGKNRKGF